MHKVVIFGIDGGAFKLVEQWQDELPNLKKMINEGVYGELESTIPPLTCPAWPSMFTGKNPGKLGMYDFTKYQIGQKQAFGLCSSLDYAPSAIWKILNKRGLKVGLLNVAMTFPPQKIDGFLVCGVGSPETAKANYTYPPRLKKTLDRVVGGYEISPPTLLGIPGKEEQYLKAFDKMLVKREKAASYLMKNLPWDLFVGVFFVMDSVQHYFWHHMDENHVRPGNKKYRDVIKDFYIKVDRAIGRLMEQVPRGTNVLVVSDHGFGPAHGSFLVNRWLEKNNLLKFKGKASPGGINAILLQTRNFLLAHLSSGLVHLVARMLPATIIRKITVREVQRDSMSAIYQSIDWPKTKAFGTGEIGAIYINLKGREPGGIVAPGQEYKKLRDEIITRLRQMADPETGGALDIQIFKKEEVYHGEYLDLAPDILYRIPKYNQAVSIEGRGEWRQAPLPGHHVPEGIFFARGPDIKQGKKKLPGLKIYDIAPTILHLFGLPVPKDMDGRVLAEIFKKENGAGRRKVTYQEIDHEVERVKRKIKELKRLKKL